MMSTVATDRNTALIPLTVDPSRLPVRRRARASSPARPASRLLVLVGSNLYRVPRRGPGGVPS